MCFRGVRVALFEGRGPEQILIDFLYFLDSSTCTESLNSYSVQNYSFSTYCSFWAWRIQNDIHSTERYTTQKFLRLAFSCLHMTCTVVFTLWFQM